MTNLRVVGKYIEREVRVAGVASLESTAFDQLHDSVLLVLFDTAFVPDATGQGFLSSLVQDCPLSISVSGIGARKAFDSLIGLLANGRDVKHTMTKVLEDHSAESAIEDLLRSTWPPEDRFDEWRSYVILNVGGDTIEIERAIEKFCD